MAQWNLGSKALFLYIYLVFLFVCATSTLSPLTREALSMALSLHNKVFKKLSPKQEKIWHQQPAPGLSLHHLLFWKPEASAPLAAAGRSLWFIITHCPTLSSLVWTLGHGEVHRHFGGVVSGYTVRNEKDRAWQIEKLTLPWYSWISPFSLRKPTPA